MISQLVSLRKELHRHPELSGKEGQTAGRILDFLVKNEVNDIITNLGGHGIAASFTYGASGPVIMIRCEMDALPIEEINGFSHRSLVKGVSHKCGHDGHMAIVAGLVFWLQQQSFRNGKVILLFQPAEENGMGAEAILQDERFLELDPDYVFALHNLPGEAIHSVIQTKGVFSATVQSVAIHLKGKQSHASEPEHGINPTPAVATLINSFNQLINGDPTSNTFTLITPIYTRIGEKAYGISAGEGELHYTIRAWTNEQMQHLKENICRATAEICEQHSLQYSFGWFDYFPAVVNADQCNNYITNAAVANELKTVQKATPLKWGDDFGWFSKKYKTGYFGLGAGSQTASLHSNDYDFPDELIPTGIKMFSEIINQILGKH